MTPLHLYAEPIVENGECSTQRDDGGASPLCKRAWCSARSVGRTSGRSHTVVRRFCFGRRDGTARGLSAKPGSFNALDHRSRNRPTLRMQQKSRREDPAQWNQRTQTNRCHSLAKVRVAGSNPVFRSRRCRTSAGLSSPADCFCGGRLPSAFALRSLSWPSRTRISPTGPRPLCGRR